MNLVELRYFLTAFRHQSLKRAAAELRVSPGAVSKAISRLEENLGISLIQYDGRRLRMTAPGRLLAKRGNELFAFEDSIRLEILGGNVPLNVKMVGPEILLLQFGQPLAFSLQKKT